ncbi:HEAT repeat domain-containing protein [Desulfosarcina sp.]|uniref:HEAT repeat domain-containing protein n=1 Tax=Desulfosarcina sp. TaxID=2027861 RepID=UPI0035632FD3
MAVTIRQFNIELYEEHLEEASFLYEQRLALLDDPEITWKDIGDFEDRFEAHIDALVVGEDLALEVCRTQAKEGDFGELHAAVRVFCRQNKGDFVAEAWRDLDPEDMERTQAISDALKDECPESWQESLQSVFLRDYFNLISVVAPVFGYRRYEAEKPLLSALKKAPSSVLPTLIWALGRTGGPATQAAVLPLLDHTDDSVCRSAAECLLRFGEPDVVTQCFARAANENWPISALGLGGGRKTAEVLIDRINQGVANNDCLIALGMLGSLKAIKALYSFLGNEDLARAATTGLYMITGADLIEEVYVPDVIDEDELFEEELDAYRKEGKVPTRPDGQPFGETIRRLSQNPQDWQAWLNENKSQFNPEIRYRLGKPYSPTGLLETLLSETSPYRARQLAIEEFKIRYGADFPIEADMPVAIQERVLQKIAQWVQANEHRFQPGAWYYSSRLMQDYQA